MLDFHSDKSKSNARDAVFAVNRSETLASLNLRLMEEDNANNLDLASHLKVLALSAGKVQHRLVMVANGNAKSATVNQRLITHQISVLAGVIASLELMAGGMPAEANDLEAKEEKRLEEVKARKQVEASFAVPVADTANVPLDEMTERKQGRRRSFKPDARHSKAPSVEQAERLRLRKSARTPQEIANGFDDYDFSQPEVVPHLSLADF